MSFGGRRRPRPYYPNQKFKHWNNNSGGYNFSSDVNVDGGSFQYGSAPPPMYQQQQQQPYGGHGANYRGRRGYNPNFGGYGQRGFYGRPQRFRGGRYPRYGGAGYGRGQYYPRAQKSWGTDSDDPFYHLSMFEDPWRFLLPKSESRANASEKKSDAKDKLSSEVVECKDKDKDGAVDGSASGGNSEALENRISRASIGTEETATCKGEEMDGVVEEEKKDNEEDSAVDESVIKESVTEENNMTPTAGE